MQGKRIRRAGPPAKNLIGVGRFICFNINTSDYGITEKTP